MISGLQQFKDAYRQINPALYNGLMPNIAVPAPQAKRCLVTEAWLRIPPERRGPSSDIIKSVANHYGVPRDLVKDIYLGVAAPKYAHNLKKALRFADKLVDKEMIKYTMLIESSYDRRWIMNNERTTEKNSPILEKTHE